MLRTSTYVVLPTLPFSISDDDSVSDEVSATGVADNTLRDFNVISTTTITQITCM